MKEKRTEEMEALEEVFDKSTLMIVYHMLNRGDLKRIFGVVKAGKESRIYWGLGPRNNDLALKIYLTTSAEFRKGMLTYLEGDPRFRRTRRDTRALIRLWAQKEFKNLELADGAGVRVPKPHAVVGNVLVMEFIGHDGVPAPLLKDVEPPKPSKIYQKLLTFVKLLYRRARLVHGDLSEYNVMLWRNQPVLFDLSQSVLLDHPLANVFLRRDLTNLNNYFSKFGVSVRPLEETYRWVTVNGG